MSAIRPVRPILPVRKAVFPVAGLGTRLLPATKSMPKEMLTVVDRPLIQYAVDEARDAGIEQLIFVTGRGKSNRSVRRGIDLRINSSTRCGAASVRGWSSSSAVSWRGAIAGLTGSAWPGAGSSGAILPHPANIRAPANQQKRFTCCSSRRRWLLVPGRAQSRQPRSATPPTIRPRDTPVRSR